MFQERHPLIGRKLASANRAPVSIHSIDNSTRFSLRIAPADLAGASGVWGAPLPPTIGEFTASAGRIAACIGPDEWYLIAPLGDQDAIEASFADFYKTTVHSLVDVGHREVGIAVEGPEAANALQSCIAADINAMPVGSARRTIIDRVQIILIHEAEDRFHIEVWHSFADHVWHLLAGICREFELGL
jgi:sarcosine oxidase, subunit gamma